MAGTIRTTILLLCLALLPGSVLHAQEAGGSVPDTATVEITASELADRLVEYAETFLGTPYRYGANGPKRFDCTAYTRYVYKKFGYTNLSRSSRDQARDGREVDISDFHNLQKGDILILGSRRNPKIVGHVGIFIGLDPSGRDPKFIHASNHGVRYSSLLTESYYSNRLLGARRILPDFEDYDVTFDSTAVYAFNPDEGVHIAPDSLVLATGDRRIVLFENGKWAYVGSDGSLSVPEAGGRLILSGDGNWAPVREAKVVIPAKALEPDPKDTESEGAAAASPKPAAAKDTTAKKATAKAAADTTQSGQATQAGQPAPQPEKVYHTVKAGDTLSKIARLHGTTVKKICDLNGITPSTILRVGRKLRVK